jgi:hypothetical protein
MRICSSVSGTEKKEKGREKKKDAKNSAACMGYFVLFTHLLHGRYVILVFVLAVYFTDMEEVV